MGMTCSVKSQLASVLRLTTTRCEAKFTMAFLPLSTPWRKLDCVGNNGTASSRNKFTIVVFVDSPLPSPPQRGGVWLAVIRIVSFRKAETMEKTIGYLVEYTGPYDPWNKRRTVVVEAGTIESATLLFHKTFPNAERVQFFSALKTVEILRHNTQ